MRNKTHQSRLRTRCIIFAAAGIVPLFTLSSAMATTRSWVVGNGSWATNTNWSTSVVPGNGDDAVMTFGDLFNSRTITYNYTGASITLNSLLLSSGANILSGNTILNMPGNVMNAVNEQIGINGNGQFNQSGGANTIVNPNNPGTFALGVNASGKGAYNLSGGNFTVTSNATAYIGSSGAGTFNHSGGEADFTRGVVIGQNLNSIGAYNLSGTGEFVGAVNSVVSVGSLGIGAFNQTGGDAQFSSLTIGDGASGKGTYTLTSGAARVNNSGSFNSAALVIGNFGEGTFNQSGGALIVGGANVGFNGFYIAMNPGSTGTFIFSGGSATNTLSTTVGYGGTGHLIHSGGTFTTNVLTIGSSGTGDYLISGNAVLSTPNMSVNNGSFTQNGGSVSIGTSPGPLQNPVFGSFIDSANYLLSAGTLNVYGAEFVGQISASSATFVQTGGVHTVKGLMVIGDLGGLLPGTVASYQLNAGTLNVTPGVVPFILGTDDTLDGLRLDTGGTITGGATDGLFTGKMTQQGGVIAGTFRNEGLIVSSSGTISGTLINRDTFNMNGTVAALQTISNESTALIGGAGTLNGGVTNRGEITPTGALAITTISNIESASINVNSNTSLRPGFIDNFSRITIAGGALLGPGTVQLEANSANGGGLLSGGGTLLTPIVLNGGILRADNPTIPLIVNSISISDPSSQIIVAPNATMNLQTPLANSVQLSLQGAGARILGATITNSGNIFGAGEVANAINNSGTIRADGGQLTLSSPSNTNLPAGQIQAGSNTVRFSHGLLTNGGVMSMADGEFNNGAASLSNSGSILGRGTFRSGTISNSGTMLFSGGVTDLFAPITNSNRINITGAGVTNFYQPVTTSTGTINVNLGSTAVFLANVTGVSHITGAGVKDFEAGASLGPINTQVASTVVGPAGNLNLDYIRDSTLSVVGKVTINPNGTAASTSRLNTLIIDGSTNNWHGQLDLKNNRMVIDYAGASPLADVQNQIKSAYAGGAWSGNGITSSLADSVVHGLGYAENSALGLSSFSGQSVDASTILIKYTYAGDSNLDGQVDLRDLYALASHYNTSGDVWTGGDFNYDGSTNVKDLTLLTTNWQAGVGAPLGSGDLAAVLGSLGLPNVTVPEPGVMAIGILIGTLRRRTRRN